MIRCITPDCERARVLGRDGWVYPMCDAHVCEALSDAFGPSWHERARVGDLRTSIVGGSERTSIVGGSDRLFSAAPGVPPVPSGAEQDARAASPGIGTG